MTPAKKRKKRRHAVRDVFIVLFSLGLFATGGVLLWGATLDIPDFNTFEQRRVAESTKIYDRTGEVLLYDIHADTRRTEVPFEDISHYAKNAAVAIEDAEFYEHPGIKISAIMRAVLVNILNIGFEQGGSTITQQVVKNALLTQEKKISRKLKEWFLAVKLEQVMSKDEILSRYLNEAPYGGNVYGIEEASRGFFDKPASELTLAESAYLAALPQAPTYFSPYGNHREELEDRKNLVLSRMLDLGFISENEYEDAKQVDVSFTPLEDRGIKAPHFVFYVRSYLEEKFGEDAVELGGLKVITTLDYEKQKKAEEIVGRIALENEEKFNAENASLVATDPHTGQILVMVGSRNYFDEEIDGNVNVALSKRQPGSAFKPFVYATAFEKGYTPETVVFDLKTQFDTGCEPNNTNDAGNLNSNCYTPQNYDEEFRGPINLRNALAQSVNIPAIKTLYLAGLNDSLQTAKDLGLKTLTNVGQYGLTLVLGGGEVRLLDMTNAYGVFANEGIYRPTTPILKIEDKQGNILEEFSPQGTRVLEEDVARTISSILSDNEARTPLYGARSLLYFPNRDVAAKTGTTNNYIDAWVMGYTPNISVGVWAGNNTPEPMNQISGLIVTPIWRAFMDEIAKDLPGDNFNAPPRVDKDIKPILRGEWKGGEEYVIDRISGKLATEHTPEETRERKVAGEVHNILHWVNKDDPRGNAPENPEGDRQYRLWEFPVQKWVEENNINQQPAEQIPTEYDDIHTPQNRPSVSITHPENYEVYSEGERIIVRVDTSGNYPLKKVDFYVNGSFIGSSETHPFLFSFTPKNIDSIKEENTLRVVVYDQVFNKNEESIFFKVR